MIEILALYMATAHVASKFLCKCVHFILRGEGEGAEKKCRSVHSLGSKATETFKNMAVQFFCFVLFFLKQVHFKYVRMCVIR